MSPPARPVLAGAPDESQVARTLREGFAWLRFEPELERAFIDEHRAANRGRIRVSVMLALGTVIGFAILDAWFEGPRTDPVLHNAVRFGLHLPIVLVILTLTSKRWFHLYWPAIHVGAPIFGLGTIVLALSAGTETGVSLVYARLVLATFFFYFMLGLSFYAALRTNAVVFVGWVVAAVLAEVSVGVTVYQTFILACANLFAGAGCYALERAHRLEFLERRMLTEVAAHDGLTGLKNRAALESEMRRAWQQAARDGEPVAVILIDIDHFKAFNDRYGHQAGDGCLREVAAAMRRAVARRPSDIVARYGGEELIAVLPGCPIERATQIARELTAAVAALDIAHAASLTATCVTVSAGVASAVPSRECSHDAIVRAADRALYAAKAAGRNRHAVFEGQPGAEEDNVGAILRSAG